MGSTTTSPSSSKVLKSSGLESIKLSHRETKESNPQILSLLEKDDVHNDMNLVILRICRSRILGLSLSWSTWVSDGSLLICEHVESTVWMCSTVLESTKNLELITERLYYPRCSEFHKTIKNWHNCYTRPHFRNYQLY
ncbi:hypothetical protein RF11_11404 [Thelohanellus kitauei]|uniref:Uncharacterized protein n=1 Tax=Thelohanellus kitauei TaxID=669202 RepID=A0A0C2MK60_THEKT|nr:hypothetical protein RF11_11404 [Thelohanellus kitauei]